MAKRRTHSVECKQQVSRGFSARTTVEKRDCIRYCRPESLGVAEGCRLMGLPRSTFYDEPTKWRDDTAIVEAIAVSARSPSIRSRLHSSEPDHGACEMDEAHEGEECLLAAECNPAKALEPVEEAFDLMAFLVAETIDRFLARALRVRPDLRPRAEIAGDEGPQGVGIIGCRSYDGLSPPSPVPDFIRAVEMV